MKRSILHSLILSLVLLALTATAALAWPEDPFAQVEISGPGIDGAVTLTGDSLHGMTIQNFMDGHYIAQPQNLGAGYELHRYFQQADGTLWDFDRVRYYADPNGGRGYVEYVQGTGYSPSQHEGQWFRATPEADATMASILASLTPAAGPSAPVLVAAPAVSAWLPASVLLTLALGLLIGVSVINLPKNVMR